MVATAGLERPRRLPSTVYSLERSFATAATNYHLPRTTYHLVVPDFQLVSDFKPTGDQPQAIDKLARDLRLGQPNQTLLGVTGSGRASPARR